MATTAGYIVHRQDSEQESQRSLDRFPDKPVTRKIYVKRILKCSGILNISLFLATLILLIIQHYVPQLDNEKRQQKLSVTGSENNSSTILSQENTDMVCISCNYLGKDLKEKDTMYDVITETPCGERLCCIKKKEEVHTVIAEMIKDKLSEGRTSASTPDNKTLTDLRWWSERKNAAHLFSNVSPDGPVTWTYADSTGLAFTNGIGLSENRLVVQTHGLYFVYAAFSFDYQGVDFVPVMYHNITSQHPLLPETGQKAHLMNKYGGSRDHEKTHTSFLCGILQLQPGFQLATQVSSHEFLDRSSYSNYFGLFQI